jgi:hypothetical protein
MAAWNDDDMLQIISLAGAGFADQQNVVDPAQEVQSGEGLYLCLADPGLAVKG